VQRLSVGKRSGARLASRRAGLNVPIVHGRGNLTMNCTGEHEENLLRANKILAVVLLVLVIELNLSRTRTRTRRRRKTHIAKSKSEQLMK
jgi:hypothetical protein